MAEARIRPSETGTRFFIDGILFQRARGYVGAACAKTMQADQERHAAAVKFVCSLEQEIAALRERLAAAEWLAVTGNELCSRLLSFCGAVAGIVECGADVDAIKRFEAALAAWRAAKEGNNAG